MAASPYTDKWVISVLDRLKDQSLRTDAQGRRLDRQEDRIDGNDDQIEAVAKAIAEIRATLRVVGAGIVLMTPVITAIVVKVIG